MFVKCFIILFAENYCTLYCLHILISVQATAERRGLCLTSVSEGASYFSISLRVFKCDRSEDGFSVTLLAKAYKAENILLLLVPTAL